MTGIGSRRAAVRGLRGKAVCSELTNTPHKYVDIDAKSSSSVVQDWNRTRDAPVLSQDECSNDELCLTRANSILLRFSFVACLFFSLLNTTDRAGSR